MVACIQKRITHTPAGTHSTNERITHIKTQKIRSFGLFVIKSLDFEKAHESSDCLLTF
jgi:hypothetical protein